MAKPFKHENFLYFDLSKGTVVSRAEERLVCVPANVLDAEDFRKAAREWGQIHGLSMVQEATGGDFDALRDAGLDVLVEHLAGIMASMGWGRVEIEVWGPGMVVKIQDLPCRVDMASGFVEGILESMAREPLRAVAFQKDHEAKLLMLSPASADKAEQLKSQGAGIGEVLDQLMGS